MLHATSLFSQMAGLFAPFCFLLFREEWEWLQTLAIVDEPITSEQDSESCHNLLLQELRKAVKDIMGQINIPLEEVTFLAGKKIKECH